MVKQQQSSELIIVLAVAVIGYFAYSKGLLDDLISQLLNNGGSGGGGGGTKPPPVTGGGGGGGGGSGSPSGPVLWDSNDYWNDGQSRIVNDTEGDQSACGGGLYMAASGSPRLIIDGDGVAHLEHDGGHGRVYIKSCNYNAMLEGEFMFEDDEIENFTFKLRNRHSMGGVCENRFGGVGCHFERSANGVKIEKCHNIHESGTDEALPKTIAKGQWIKVRFYVHDTEDGSGIAQKIEIDFNDGNGFVETLNSVFGSPQDFYMDKETFLNESEFWIRVNSSGRGKVAMKNVRLIDLEAEIPVAEEEESAYARAYYNTYQQPVIPTIYSYNRISC